MIIEYVERLTLNQRFRLIEIAHDTRDADLRNAVFSLLEANHYQEFPPIPCPTGLTTDDAA
jgi:hypothetical protein